jgi:hypothetical protein
MTYKSGMNLNWFHKPVSTGPNTIDEITIKNLLCVPFKICIKSCQNPIFF